MPAVAKVVADIALDREFDYLIPDELRNVVRHGSRVFIPFGRSRRVGYVVGFADDSDHPRLKPILSVVGEKPFLDRRMLKLVRWVGDYYCATVEQSIRTALPGAVRRSKAHFKRRLRVTLCATQQAAGEGSAVRKPSAKQLSVLNLLQSRDGMLLADLTRELGISDAPVRTLEKKGIVCIRAEDVKRGPLSKRRILSTQPLDLMPAQACALDMIGKSVDTLDPPVVLLYGVTGSGKTEVYLQAISHVLAQGRGAIVLVPEISLTPQTVERFVGRFGKRVAVMHSHLSEGERHDEWHKIRDGEASIVIGARSAVFAPVKRLGLIVVDEEHEPSYKQEETPRYNARDTAVMRGRIDKCAVLLGSATPSLESWRNALSGKYGLTKLPERADDRKMPTVRVVDMRIEAERTGRAGVFSGDLLEAVRLRLDRAEQTILFLNRRGFATSLICRRCGYVANCDHCSVSFTYHRKDERLRCHVCGGVHLVPGKCPSCGDPAFKLSGVGTQRVERAVAKCFPHARVQRMDSDVTTRKDDYERILGDFRSGRIDILIGTQMIAKGLHFPNVTLVGVIYADLSLHMPDFRAGERTFQLLAQVAGRAGRGVVPGEVIVQTHTPFHAAVQAARRVEFERFCDQEMEFRRELRYPPFTHLVCITMKGTSEERVSHCVSWLSGRLKTVLSGRAIVSDATAAPLAKAKGQYRYQVMMRSRSVKAMTIPLREILSGLSLPRGIACSVDVDAISLL